MLNRMLTIGITVFWVAMMVQLAKREVVPSLVAAREASRTANYSELERLASKPRVDQMGIYLKDRRIGFSLSRLRIQHGELQMESRTRIKLNLSEGNAPASALGLGSLDMSTHFKARVRDGELQDFRVTVSSPPGAPPLATIDGTPIGKILRLKIRHGESVQYESMPFDSRQLISNGFAQAFVPRTLKVGMRWPIRTLNPFTRGVQVSMAEVVGMDTVVIDDAEIAAYVIEVSYGSSTMTIWADEDGGVLKQQLFGFTFIREAPPPDALDRSKL